MEHGGDFERLGNAIDREAVSVNHHLAGSGRSSGARDVRVIGRITGGVHDCGDASLNIRAIARSNMLENGWQVALRIVRRGEPPRQRASRSPMIA